MRHRVWVCGLLVLAAFLVFENQMCAAEMKERESAALALFRQYETVFYADSSLLASTGTQDDLAKAGAAVMRTPYINLLEGLNSLSANASAEMLRNSESVLVGAREFGPPRGLGAVHSLRCYIILLRPHSRFDIRKYAHTTKVTATNGVEVLNWSANLNEFGEEDPRPSAFYATQISDSFVLIANDINDLQATALELSGKMDSEVSAQEIREWDIVSRHRIWGYRRYRHTGIVAPGAAATSFVTPKTDALISFVDFGKSSVTVRILGSSTFEDTAIKMRAIANVPDFKPIGAGILETSFPLALDATCSDRLIRIMFLFGFGAYV